MKKILFFNLLLVSVLIAVGGLTMAQDDKMKDMKMDKKEMKGKAKGGRPMMITMTGKSEVPGPGDTDGSGTASITLNGGQGQVCYDIKVKNIGTPTAAHIHAGAVGVAGDPKVTLTAAADGSWKSCANADKELVMDLMKNPANYYVNVHNAEFPNGAIRGQLKK